MFDDRLRIRSRIVFLSTVFNSLSCWSMRIHLQNTFRWLTSSRLIRDSAFYTWCECSNFHASRKLAEGKNFHASRKLVVNWGLLVQYFGRSIAVESPKMKKPTTIRTTSLSLSKARRAWFRMKMIEIVAIVVGFSILEERTAVDLPKYCNTRLQLTPPILSVHSLSPTSYLHLTHTHTLPLFSLPPL